NVDIRHGDRFIKIEQPPSSFLQAMEEYVTEAPRASNVRVNAKRSAITHSRHSNVEQKDIVAAVQQVSPFAKHLRHTIATHNAYVFLVSLTFGFVCCTSVDHPSNNYSYYADTGVDDNHSVITHSRHVNAGQEGVATDVQQRSRKPDVALSDTQKTTRRPHLRVPWSNERPLEKKELNTIIGAWFTLWRD
ncbi:hypothetical protein Tco_1227443, partial [Tanacetum coccineum]